MTQSYQRNQKPEVNSPLKQFITSCSSDNQFMDDHKPKPIIIIKFRKPSTILTDA